MNNYIKKKPTNHQYGIKFTTKSDYTPDLILSKI